MCATKSVRIHRQGCRVAAKGEIITYHNESGVSIGVSVSGHCHSSFRRRQSLYLCRVSFSTLPNTFLCDANSMLKMFGQIGKELHWRGNRLGNRLA